MNWYLSVLGCVWIKDLAREKEMEKLEDPTVRDHWILEIFPFPFPFPSSNPWSKYSLNISLNCSTQQQCSVPSSLSTLDRDFHSLFQLNVVQIKEIPMIPIWGIGILKKSTSNFCSIPGPSSDLWLINPTQVLIGEALIKESSFLEQHLICISKSNKFMKF